MISKKVNTSLILAVTCLYHTIQELFCQDGEKRERALKEYQEYKTTFINLLDYVSEQANMFHALHTEKGGVSDGNSSTAAVETKKRAA